MGLCFSGSSWLEGLPVAGFLDGAVEEPMLALSNDVDMNEMGWTLGCVCGEESERDGCGFHFSPSSPFV